MRLFIICNIVYFLLQPFTLFAPFTSTLQIQTHERPWKEWASELVDAKLAARGSTLEEYAKTYDEAAHLQGKTLVILMVPLFALGAWALHARTRRFYAEHLVVSFYTYAFLLLWFAFSTFVLSKTFIALARSGVQLNGDVLENVSTPVIAVPFAIYLLFAERGAYGEPWASASVKAVALVFWAYAVLTAYRFVLFFTAFYATRETRPNPVLAESQSLRPPTSKYFALARSSGNVELRTHAMCLSDLDSRPAEQLKPTAVFSFTAVARELCSALSLIDRNRPVAALRSW